MGGKDSKLSPLTYEDAVQRVSESEFKRLKLAYRKSATSGLMSKSVFLNEVLGESVPCSEQIFNLFGGSQRGLSFKDLLCGLVLLTRGSKDEKIKFLFNFYASESSTYVFKNDWISSVQKLEEKNSVDKLNSLLNDVDKLSLEEFSKLLKERPDVTTFSCWLLSDPPTVSLSNDLEMPTFYQTLAGVTHLEEADIVELEKKYWALKATSESGKFDLETFGPLVCPPIPKEVLTGLFNAFDENQDNHIDFKELACGVSAACRGPDLERQKFIFKIFDGDMDGFMEIQEVKNMVTIMLQVYNESRLNELEGHHQYDFECVLCNILPNYTQNKNTQLSLEDYLVWTLNIYLPQDFLELIVQVCHIVLGLKPANKCEESSVIRKWMKREINRGYQVGQYWYLVNYDWWISWNEYSDYHCDNSECGSNLSTPTQSQSGSLQRPTKSVCRESDNSLLTSGTSLTISEIDAKKNGTEKEGFRIYNASPSPNASPRLCRRVQNPMSSMPPTPSHPGAIDNSSLIQPSLYKVASLTNEGGRLKNIIEGKDYCAVPEAVWRALVQWYGGGPAIPRLVQSTPDSVSSLELYPTTLKILRHQLSTSLQNGVVGSYNTGTMSTAGYSYIAMVPPTPRTTLTWTASFSQQFSIQQVNEFLCRRLSLHVDDVRLWHIKDENNMTLLEEEEISLQSLGIRDNDQILLEIRNKDLTWPEEISSLAGISKPKNQTPLDKGVTGLNNLGNTCFMNAALQCVSNTRPLSEYFTKDCHLYELNRNNPFGMKGYIARRYGDLIQELWSGTSKTVAPLKLRWTISKYAPRFSGCQQHDSQEFLAFLLDGLHEDLNRVHNKPYIELKDSNGRPDNIVAKEAWDNHLLRNKSIIIDLFHGQLKSKVTCKVCGHESVTFDPFSYLTLQLPLENFKHLEIVVIRLNGTVPVRYGVSINPEDKWSNVKCQLSKLCGIPSHRLILAEVESSVVKNVLSDNNPISVSLNSPLFCYELPLHVGSTIIKSRPEFKSCRERETFSLIQRSTSHVKSNDKSHFADMTTSKGAMLNGSHINECPEKFGAQSSLVVNGNESCAHSDNNCDSFYSDLSSLQSKCSDKLGTEDSDSDATQIPTHAIAFHRKMIRQELYFLSAQKTKPSLFGTPLILPYNNTTTNQDLYQAVWIQVSRLVSPLPPSEFSPLNHALDCDDSLGYEYPFCLRMVQSNGVQCALCPWFLFCKGCKIPCTDADLFMGCPFIAIDWDPTALHLRYQASQERLYSDHKTVVECKQRQSEPITLTQCLDAFTKVEHLGEEEKYYCAKCKERQQAFKILQIWRLPPILIIHLKRFQHYNGNWVKSQKVVKFPFQDFDPTPYLASVPKHTVKYYQYLKSLDKLADASESRARNNIPHTAYHQLNSHDSGIEFEFEASCSPNNVHSFMSLTNCAKGDYRYSNSRCHSPETVSNNDKASQVTANDQACPDFHNHHLISGTDPFELKYNLYAIACHTGLLGGGHYISYALHPNGKWFCYNDSSSKEVSKEHIDCLSAYMLFYERDGLDYSKYLPKTDGKVYDDTEIDDDIENDYKRMCRLV